MSLSAEDVLACERGEDAFDARIEAIKREREAASEVVAQAKARTDELNDRETVLVGREEALAAARAELENEKTAFAAEKAEVERQRAELREILAPYAE